ncbi:DUF2934 domain-containing protein [Ancylobacter lacus]|uniref:DUF2934 domain-containing protein n=1 Tax=Ancylobacter lacus TaxID=2579970 RepID=UPI001BD14DD1|nr:DUF2934 domain-containing protein [Ancylobacter lacus]MBS7538251.1 DUF2934 domain-containing protein [Ancylobacter lacus]
MTSPDSHPAISEETTADDHAAREDAIRAGAHARWESEGRPEGRAEAHWLEAERDLGAASGPSATGEAGADDLDDMPPAGPHARPELTNPDSTAGSGMLPAIGADEDPNAQPSG